MEALFLCEAVAVIYLLEYDSIMKYIWIALFCVISAVNAEVYRWYDEHGRLVYSDEYHPNAEVVDVRNLSTYTPTPTQQLVVTANEQAPEDEGVAEIPNYQVSIISPENDQSVWQNDGNLAVSVDIKPPLDKERGDKLLVMVDGQQQGDAIPTVSFTLSNLDRGTHSIVVSVVDDKGKLLKLSQPVTFHLHRRSVAQ